MISCSNSHIYCTSHIYYPQTQKLGTYVSRNYTLYLHTITIHIHPFDLKRYTFWYTMEGGEKPASISVDSAVADKVSISVCGEVKQPFEAQQLSHKYGAAHIPKANTNSSNKIKAAYAHRSRSQSKMQWTKLIGLLYI